MSLPLGASSSNNIYEPITAVQYTAVASIYTPIAGDVIPPPPFLTVTSTLDTTNINMPIYHIIFGNMLATVNVYIIAGVPSYNATPGVSVELRTITPLVIIVKLVNLSIGINLYNPGDTYTLALDAFNGNTQVLNVIAGRQRNIQLTTFSGAGGGITETINVNSQNALVRIPIIDIQGQTTMDGEYLSDMTFVIQDKYKYKCHENIINEKSCKDKSCKDHYSTPHKLKTTTFYKNNIPLQCVVKGKGKSLQDKVYNISTSINEPNFQNFYERFILYGMLKYILIRLIYGEYDLNKMCRNYNKQFFKDLIHTRFCGFIEFFENPENGIIDFDRFYIKCEC